MDFQFPIWWVATKGSVETLSWEDGSASLAAWFFLVEPCFHAVSGQAGVVSHFGDFAIRRRRLSRPKAVSKPAACSTIERADGVAAKCPQGIRTGVAESR